MLEQTWRGRQMLSYQRAYGGGYDFCRFFRLQYPEGTGWMFLFNATLLICAAQPIPSEEIVTFVRMHLPFRIECPQFLLPALAEIPNYQKLHRATFELVPSRPSAQFSPEEVALQPKLQDVYGIMYIPENFDTRINRMEQGTVSIYCNMALMLTYKAIYQTATAVIADMNSEIQIALSGNYTDREDEITASPINIEEVAMFNTTGGYGSFILPGVLILILQQVMLLSIGMRNGTIRERRSSVAITEKDGNTAGLISVVAGKTLCYLALFVVLATYVLLAIPRIFNFVHTIHAGDFALFILPYLLACIFFAMTVSCFIKERENVMLLVVFTSVPLLFLSGISWPASNIPEFWKYLSYIFPSTFGIQAFIKMNSMGATFSDITSEYQCLWIQAAVYFLTSCVVYSRMIAASKNKEKQK